jgi:hypothetical protein
MIKELDWYKGFGLRQEWFHRFLTYGEDWNINSPLGNRQIEGFTRWLVDAGLWDKNRPTELGEIMIQDGRSDNSVLWLTIWAHLSFRSPVVKWYAYCIPSGTYWKSDLAGMLSRYRNMAVPNRTDLNAINALTETLRRSPLGEKWGAGGLSRVSNRARIVKTMPHEGIPLHALMIDLSLLGREIGKTQLFAHDLRSDQQFSPCRLFQITESQLGEACRQSCRLFPEFIQNIEGKGSNLIKLLPFATPENILRDLLNRIKK